MRNFFPSHRSSYDKKAGTELVYVRRLREGGFFLKNPMFGKKSLLPKCAQFGSLAPIEFFRSDTCLPWFKRHLILLYYVTRSAPRPFWGRR